MFDEKKTENINAAIELLEAAETIARAKNIDLQIALEALKAVKIIEGVQGIELYARDIASGITVYEHE